MADVQPIRLVSACCGFVWWHAPGLPQSSLSVALLACPQQAQGA